MGWPSKLKSGDFHKQLDEFSRILKFSCWQGLAGCQNGVRKDSHKQVNELARISNLQVGRPGLATKTELGKILISNFMN